MSRSRNTLYSLLALLAIGITIGGADAKQPSRIIGGELSTDIAYCVALAVTKPEGLILCGGGIVSPRHVLTAGHCVHNVNSNDIIVHAGIRDLRDRKNEVVRSVAKVIVHSAYISFIAEKRNVQNDVAILVLEDALPIGSRIAMLRIPTQQPQIGATYTIAGWGQTNLDPDSSSYDLKKLDVKLASPYVCGHFPPHTFCGYADNGSPCFGDSGSPLVRDDYVYGFLSTSNCTAGALAGYVNVYDYRNWISFNIRRNP